MCAYMCVLLNIFCLFTYVTCSHCLINKTPRPVYLCDCTISLRMLYIHVYVLSFTLQNRNFCCECICVHLLSKGLCVLWCRCMAYSYFSALHLSFKTRKWVFVYKLYYVFLIRIVVQTISCIRECIYFEFSFLSSFSLPFIILITVSYS